jgi:hypothetical protein
MNYAAWAVSGVKDGNSTATVSVVDLQSFNVRARVPPQSRSLLLCALTRTRTTAHTRHTAHDTRHTTHTGDTHVDVRGSSMGHRLARHLPDLRVFTSTSMPLET